MKRHLLILGFLMGMGSGFSQTPLNEPDLEEFKILAEIKARDFSSYIITIASKTRSIRDKETAIDLACKLFINDTVAIQVSSCPSSGKPTIHNRTLIEYLRRLSVLNYDKVTIEWIEVDIVKEIKKGSNGNYYGTISFTQKFTAVKNEYIYSDVVTKHMTVVLKPYLKPNDLGEDEWQWGVYLSNVNVVEPCS